MFNSRHSQPWLLAGKLLALVSVILFIGGTLYLVKTRLVPTPSPDSLLARDQPVANLPKAITPSPPAHIGTLSQRADPVL